ncbi:21326_t:CDS:1, partial [Gigaspora margarita]
NNFKVSQSTTPSIPLSHISNLENEISEEDKSLLKVEVSISSETYVSNLSKLFQENNLVIK